MQIQKNILLALYTTFKIGGPAKFFCVVKDQFDALEAYEFAKANNLEVFVLGGGSNILVSDEGFKGLVIKVECKGIEVVEDGKEYILLKVASGENWDEVVKFAVNNDWWGMENLSHIPGSTGAIAVQNVGAYGQEAKNIITSVTVFNRETHEVQNLAASDCSFSYRSSIFNSIAKGKYIIFYINFKLSTKPSPILGYRDLQQYFSSEVTLSVPTESEYLPQKGESNNVLSLASIRQAIIYIRDLKFPFPTQAVKGNAGSFFKNPVLSGNQYQNLESTMLRNFGEDCVNILKQKKFLDNSNIKIPAAYLIEACGLKDLSNSQVAINPNQPLVIINKSGKATAKDILELAEKVRSEVLHKTGITLQFEPELIGFN